MQNCLSYALDFWSCNKKYIIYYDSDHCVNSETCLKCAGYLPLLDFGYDHVYSSFKHQLNHSDLYLLKLYFNVK
jgi:hypothetical protein